MTEREAAAASARPLPIRPMYFVRHPDGSYSIAEPQPTPEQIAAQAEYRYAQCDRTHGGSCCEDPYCYRAASAPQAVRMLTKAELMGLACIYHECNIDPEAAIRKFCEVNGLGIVPLAPQDTGGEA